MLTHKAATLIFFIIVFNSRIIVFSFFPFVRKILSISPEAHVHTVKLFYFIYILIITIAFYYGKYKYMQMWLIYIDWQVKALPKY